MPPWLEIGAPVIARSYCVVFQGLDLGWWAELTLSVNLGKHVRTCRSFDPDGTAAASLASEGGELVGGRIGMSVRGWRSSGSGNRLKHDQGQPERHMWCQESVGKGTEIPVVQTSANY